jgi:membrane protein YqaA with SNARE-associated domain
MFSSTEEGGLGETHPTAPERTATPRWHLHRRLYRWVLHWAETRYGAPALFVLAFAESSFFPVPPDVLLIALVLGARRKAWRLAGICSVASIVGGMAGYLIGFTVWNAGVDDFFFRHIPGFDRDRVEVTASSTTHALVGLIDSPRVEWPLRFTPRRGQPVTLERDQVKDEPTVGSYTKIRWAYEQWGFWVVWTAGFTPVPYKLITITAGVFHINFPVFLAASATSRSVRFFLVALLMWWAGPAMKRWIERYFDLVSLAFVALLIGGILAVKYLF